MKSPHEEQAQPEWGVRQVQECPTLVLEGFSMFRILDGSGFEGVGCEFVELDPHKVLEPHVHRKGHAIILVLEGSGFALIGDEKFPLKKHSIMNVPPGTVHGLEASDEKLVVYGFQVPGIIDDNNDADIYFVEGGRKGEVQQEYPVS